MSKNATKLCIEEYIETQYCPPSQHFDASQIKQFRNEVEHFAKNKSKELNDFLNWWKQKRHFIQRKRLIKLSCFYLRFYIYSYSHYKDVALNSMMTFLEFQKEVKLHKYKKRKWNDKGVAKDDIEIRILESKIGALNFIKSKRNFRRNALWTICGALILATASIFLGNALLSLL